MPGTVIRGKYKYLHNISYRTDSTEGRARVSLTVLSDFSVNTVRLVWQECQVRPKWHLLNDLDLVPTVLRGNAYWTINLTPVWVPTQERGNQRSGRNVRSGSIS